MKFPPPRLTPYRKREVGGLPGIVLLDGDGTSVGVEDGAVREVVDANAVGFVSQAEFLPVEGGVAGFLEFAHSLLWRYEALHRVTTRASTGDTRGRYTQLFFRRFAQQRGRGHAENAGKCHRAPN